MSSSAKDPDEIEAFYAFGVYDDGPYYISTYAAHAAWVIEKRRFERWQHKIANAGFTPVDDGPKQPGAKAWPGITVEQLDKLRERRHEDAVFRAKFDADMAAGVELQGPEIRVEPVESSTDSLGDRIRRAFMDNAHTMGVP